MFLGHWPVHIFGASHRNVTGNWMFLVSGCFSRCFKVFFVMFIGKLNDIFGYVKMIND